MNQEFGLSIYILLYMMDNQQGPTKQHRELYFIITYKGKESEREFTHTVTHTHTHTHTNHFAVHQKLTQHCKSTVLQLKINKPHDRLCKAFTILPTPHFSSSSLTPILPFCVPSASRLSEQAICSKFEDIKFGR